MRILFVTSPSVSGSLGGSKPQAELAHEFGILGWEADLLSLADEVPGDAERMRIPRAEFLRNVVLARGEDYDVIDFDHEYLPYARQTLPGSVLLVARSVLLAHHVASSTFPRSNSMRRVAGAVLKGRRRVRSRREFLRFAQFTVEQADLVNVSNDQDRSMLIRSGVLDDKIVVFPFGLSDDRAAAFGKLPCERGHQNVVAFVGTFDWRKGAADMPDIMRMVATSVPGVKFRLLGTRGMYATARDVARHFPKSLRRHLEVVPAFEPPSLPDLLSDCALGFFPSYIEGFGFGVLEMLAAGLPVIAYDVPGPSMMLPSSRLVSPGDRATMAARITQLLVDPAGLEAARLSARLRSQDFRWDAIARSTASTYAAALRRRRHLRMTVSTGSGY